MTDLPKWAYSIVSGTRDRIVSQCPWCDMTFIGIYNCKHCPKCSMPTGMHKGLPFKFLSTTPVPAPYYNYAVVANPEKYAKRFWNRMRRLIKE